VGGILHTPHTVSSEELAKWGKTVNRSTESRFELDEQTIDIVSKGLWGVVNEWGTARRAMIPGFDVCGKTGTAQVIGKEAQSSMGSKRKSSKTMPGLSGSHLFIPPKLPGRHSLSTGHGGEARSTHFA
jgi:cell division protein FtsI/penicillin-binding protein 2